MKNNMMISNNKTLKLNNILVKKLNKNEIENYPKTVELFDNYIKNKKAMPIGPIIQYSKNIINEDNILDIEVTLMRQCSSYIQSVEIPYEMHKEIKVQNCMYVRFKGYLSDLRFAYNKIILAAYEEDIELVGDSYTVLVEETDDYVVVDVFMEKKKHG